MATKSSKDANTKKMGKVFTALTKDQPAYNKPANRRLTDKMKRITTTEYRK